MTIGEFVTINSFIMLIVGPLIGFGGLYFNCSKRFSLLRSHYRFMQLPTETIEDSVDVLALEDIQVRYLDFNYETLKVMHYLK